MTIVGIPDIIVLEPIHVHIEPVIVVEVHVGNEEMSNKPSMTLPFEYSLSCILFGT
jgi:hypothetical protein